MVLRVIAGNQLSEHKAPDDEIHNCCGNTSENNTSVVHVRSFGIRKFFLQNRTAQTGWPANSSSRLSNASMVPCETILQRLGSGNPSCVRTTLVWLPCAMHFTMTPDTAGSSI